ncbi:MAG: histidine phosphatase family protein [Verrucomicrobia bacterium]|nr:histidine phosphatase family protein [Verrucomicrobiota bacterium]
MSNSNSFTRLLLIRHAEVEARYQGIFGGRIDMDLSPRGHTQAAALAEFLRHKPLDALYASPMKRVQQTLAPFRNNGAPQPVVMPDLREVDFGDWTGFNYDEVQTKFGVNASTWLAQLEEDLIPNAESGPVYRARIEPCLREILARHPGQTVAVFCHGGVTRMMLSILLDLPFPKTDGFQIEYASVTQVALKPHHTVIELLNFTPWRDLPA